VKRVPYTRLRLEAVPSPAFLRKVAATRQWPLKAAAAAPAKRKRAAAAAALAKLKRAAVAAAPAKRQRNA